MTDEERAQFYVGCKVAIKDLVKYSAYVGWIGEVIECDYTNQIIKIKTIESDKGGRHSIGEINTWTWRALKIIEPEIIINLPENKHPCPRCKSLDCKGLARLDCITK